MNYSLEIRKHNQQAHLDIESDIKARKDGLFTFTLRVNNGNIVDYVVYEYADARKYLVLKKIVIEEFAVARTDRVGGEPDSIRVDNV